MLAALEMKLDLLESCDTDITKEKIQKVVSTIMGNDLNRDSIVITKVRLFLCIVHRYGAERAKGLAEILKHCFASYDFVITEPNRQKKYDIIVGNPPYVEDLKSENVPEKRYGNIYANVLENAALHLKQGGVLGFVIPLSYVATPRMKKIRDELYQYVPEQYILSYADRPDCLFTSVHQKLCVFWGKHSEKERNIYTGNYQYWYREERQNLFKSPAIVKNDFVAENYIPKLGTKTDVNIYQKIVSADRPMLELLETGENGIYLNTRATFWMKAFLKEHAGSEYKKFRCCNQEYANLCMCLLNSSLFWWYWITVSDCWHITRKELLGFMVPRTDIFAETDRLATALEERLEETKVYVGTKQTEYEYRHRACIKEIHQIDDYINALYGLTEEEGLYIKNFAYRYRVSGGADSECN